MPSQGFIYVATGEKYRRQAVVSIQCLLSKNSEFPVTLFTDKDEGLGAVRGKLDRIILIDEPRFSFIDKIEGFLNSPYEKTVFLDCDTITVACIGELFELLDRFDLAACHAPGYSGARFHRYESAELPASFVQFNTGVVCFRSSAQVLKVFEEWRELYRSSPDHLHDQPAFRAVVYKSDLDVYVLPPEYNFLIGPAYFSGAVKVFHGLSVFSKPEIISTVNRSTGPRAFVPPDKVFLLR